MIGTLAESFSTAAQTTVNYDGTAVEVLTAGLSKRSGVLICNQSATSLYVGLGTPNEAASSEVSTANYIYQLTQGQTVFIGAKETVGIYLVGSASGTATLCEVMS